jgi:hypothetical protein
MPKFTKLQKARICAEADMHIAIRRADVARQRYLLLLEKEKIVDASRARVAESMSASLAVSLPEKSDLTARQLRSSRSAVFTACATSVAISPS